jgi:hypothetical protein
MLKLVVNLLLLLLLLLLQEARGLSSDCCHTSGDLLVEQNGIPVRMFQADLY